MSKILVTGAAGFIGQHVCNQLQTLGHDVIAVDDLSGGHKQPQNVEFLYGDVSTPLLWNSVGNVDGVIHLAASFANYRSVLHPDIDMRCNIEGSLRTALFARDRGIPLVYAGSSSSYGAAEQVGEGIRPFFEVDRLNPTTPYALSKHTGEEYALMLCPQAVSLRLFNVFGPGDPPGEFRNALPNMIQAALLGQNLEVYGECSRDFTPVSMVAFVFADMMERLLNKVPTYRTINVCSGAERFIGSIANHIASQVGSDMVTVIHKKPRAWDSVPRRVGHPGRLVSTYPGILDAQPSFRDELDRTIEWVRDYRA